jgi:hypothetical protein
VNISDLAVLAAAQPARDGISPLSAALVGAGVCLPASWPTAGTSTKRPRPGSRPAAGFTVVELAGVTKPGDTNIRNQHTNMTRVYADGEGGSGPQPLRKPA